MTIYPIDAQKNVLWILGHHSGHMNIYLSLPFSNIHMHTHTHTHTHTSQGRDASGLLTDEIDADGPTLGTFISVLPSLPPSISLSLKQVISQHGAFTRQHHIDSPDIYCMEPIHTPALHLPPSSQHRSQTDFWSPFNFNLNSRTQWAHKTPTTSPAPTVDEQVWRLLIEAFLMVNDEY